MKSKALLYAVIAVLLLLFVLGSWRFILGFAVAIALCWYFGFDRVKQVLISFWEQAQKLWKTVSQDLGDKEETVDAVITDSFVVPFTSESGKFQIIINAAGKSYMLKPTESGVLPSCLEKGKPIRIRKKISYHGLTAITAVSLIADGQVFETL